MAQRPMILGFEPRLKGNFVAIFRVIKALQFQCFFTLYIYSPHYQNINISDFAIESIRFVNLQKRKGNRLRPLFSNQISLVTLRSWLTISGQPKFLIPCTFLYITLIMDHPVQSNNIKMTIYINTFEYLKNLKIKTK